MNAEQSEHRPDVDVVKNVARQNVCAVTNAGNLSVPAVMYVTLQGLLLTRNVIVTLARHAKWHHVDAVDVQAVEESMQSVCVNFALGVRKRRQNAAVPIATRARRIFQLVPVHPVNTAFTDRTIALA